jgi:SEC-C motif-containing protein
MARAATTPTRATTPTPTRGVARPRRGDARARPRRATRASAKKRKGFAELLGGAASDDGDARAERAGATTSAKGKAARRAEARCPCGGGRDGLTYASCCKRFHDGDAYPEDPVTLMRTRFSAYAKGKGLYVVKTTHPDNPLLMEGAKTKTGKVVSTLARDVEATCKKVRFYDLDIVRDVKGKGKGDAREHLVGFRYKCRVVGQQGFNELPEEKHAELSTFRTTTDDDGNEVWKFVDGIQGST